jgi:hypothetical protein
MKTIREAATELCDRWDTPLWKEAEHTAVFIHELRMALAQPEQEPLEYWNAVEGWVKIDEVRQHFETVSCGTIYKTAGEGRVPLYTAPPKRQPLTDQRINEIYQEATCQSLRPQDYKLAREFARAIEAAHDIKETT